MKTKLFLAAAGMALVAMPAEASSEASDSQTQKVTVACPKGDPPAKPENHVDFSGTPPDLQFDPLAPGGARPIEPQGKQSAGIDPTTVTLFPPTAVDTAKKGTKDHDAKKACP